MDLSVDLTIPLFQNSLKPYLHTQLSQIRAFRFQNSQYAASFQKRTDKLQALNDYGTTPSFHLDYPKTILHKLAGTETGDFTLA